MRSAAGVRHVRPSRENTGKLRNLRLRKSGKRRAVEVSPHAAVAVELRKTEREELHQFASEVFIGRGTGLGVDLVVVDHVEELAHRRIQSNVLHYLAIVGEGIVLQYPQVRYVGMRIVHLHAGNDKDLVQCKRHPLAQLILTCHGVAEELRLRPVHAFRIDRRWIHRWRSRELRSQPCLISKSL